MAAFKLALTLCLAWVGFAQNGFQMAQEKQNGNIAIKVSEEYLNGQKQLLFRDFAKELEKFSLSDVTIRQKTDQARLTAYMNQISLHSIDLEGAESKLTFGHEQDSQAIQFRLSKVQMTLSFDHWLEVETAKTEEEWGVGLFEVNGIEFECTFKVELIEDKLKARIASSDLRIKGDHAMQLYTQTDSKFSELLKQFGGVFSQNMRQHLNVELGSRLAIAGQSTVQKLIRRLVQNNRVGSSEILINKYINNVQLIQSDGQNHLTIEYDGTFYRLSHGITGETPKPAESLVNRTTMGADSNIQFVIGKNSFTSLLAAVFNEKEKVRVFTEPISMKVSQLDEFIDSYSTVFDEKAIIDITTEVEKVDLVSFEPTFQNVAFKADLVVMFSNPINTQFKSAKVRVSVRGYTTISVNERGALVLQLTLDQTIVTKLSPMFYTETSRKEFEKIFKKKLMPKILQGFQSTLAKGIQLPLGKPENLLFTNTKATIQEDFIILEAAVDQSDQTLPSSMKVTLQDQKSQAMQLRKYPVVYQIDSDNSVRIIPDVEACLDEETQPSVKSEL